MVTNVNNRTEANFIIPETKKVDSETKTAPDLSVRRCTLQSDVSTLGVNFLTDALAEVRHAHDAFVHALAGTDGDLAVLGLLVAHHQHEGHLLQLGLTDLLAA